MAQESLDFISPGPTNSKVQSIYPISRYAHYTHTHTHICIHICILYMPHRSVDRKDSTSTNTDSTIGLILFPFLPDQIKISFAEKRNKQMHNYTQAHIYMEIHYMAPCGSWPQALSLPSSCPWTLALLSCWHLDMCLLQGLSPTSVPGAEVPITHRYRRVSISTLKHAADELGSPGFTVGSNRHIHTETRK